MSNFCYSIMAFHGLLPSPYIQRKNMGVTPNTHWGFIHSFTISLLPDDDCYRWPEEGKRKNKTKTSSETHHGRAGNKRWLVRARSTLEKLWRRGKTRDKVPNGVTKGVLGNPWAYIWKAQDFPLTQICPSPRERKGNNLDSWYCLLLTPGLSVLTSHMP